VRLTVTMTPAPAISVLKSTTKTVTDSGQKIWYYFLVTGTGNVPLTGVRLADAVSRRSFKSHDGPACRWQT
jgi:uncharacterized repeat protein (TIGR01451 family)